MNNTSARSNSSSIDTIFAQLNQHDIEDFYAGYQCWYLRQQITALQSRIGDLHRQIAENTQRMQEVQPSAIALATLARLQSNGVNDIHLLDRMLEQGELWLDRTMQRLEYFEQLNDFISDDYTQWCQLALEGAYDWIDSMLDGSLPSSSPAEASKEEELVEATEELFLQKLISDELEDASSPLEITLKRPAITEAHPSEPPPPPEDISAEKASLPEEEAPISEPPPQSEAISSALEIASIVEEASPAQEENFPGDVMPASALRVEADLTQEHGETDVTQAPVEELPFEEPVSEDTEVNRLSSDPEIHEQHQKNETPKRPNVIRRFIGRIWGSQA